MTKYTKDTEEQQEANQLVQQLGILLGLCDEPDDQVQSMKQGLQECRPVPYPDLQEDLYQDHQ